MSIKKNLDRLEYVDFLIRTKATGDTNALAKKLHLSRSYTLACIKEMKELGFPIKYSLSEKHYYYEEEGMMVKNLFIRAGKEGGGSKNQELKKRFYFFLKSENKRLVVTNFTEVFTGF